MATHLNLGFDVYGTLIDTHGVVIELQNYIGDLAPRFSQVWREKQLEYTFRIGLMDRYQPFGFCTEKALEYTDQLLQCGLSQQQKATLIQCYSALPAFDDAIDGLEQAKSAGFGLFAFSNGQAAAVNQVLDNAGISDYFSGTVSVDTISTFKPNPRVYEHFIQSTKSDPACAWLVSSNGFDVIGAVSAGMKAAWVQRSTSVVYDPWGIEPTVTIDSLTKLVDELKNQ